MRARALIVGILAVALVAGAALYWLQVYAFYREVGPEAGPVLLVSQGTGAPEALAVEGLRAIDADSSPIRYRACFTTPTPLVDLVARYAPYPDAQPLNAPGWFDCFDAEAVGEALEAGSARAFLSVPDLRYGIDRVVAILPDGRGVAWQQINACGAVVFDGEPAPEGCPPVPEGF